MRNQLSVRDSVKYTATLALLVGFAMTTPAVQSAFQTSVSFDLSPTAAVASSIPALPVAAVASTQGLATVADTAIACPAGYVCSPNPKLTVSSVVINGPTPTVVSYRFNIAGVDRIELMLSANGSYAPVPGFSATAHGVGNQWGGGPSALGSNIIMTRGHTIAEWQVDFTNKTGKDVLVGLKAVGYTGNKQVGADADALTIAAKPTSPFCPFGYTCAPAQPTVSSVSPTKVTLGTSTSMTMYGSNFNSTLMIGITGPGSDTSVKPDSIAADGSAMTFTFPGSINVPGTYNIYPYNYGKAAYGSVNVTDVAPAAPGVLSLDPASPLAGKTDQALAVPVLAFDLRVSGGPVIFSKVNVNFSVPGGSGSLAGAYLYSGQTMVGYTTVVNGVASFSVATTSIPAGITEPFVVKVDVPTVGANGIVIAASVSSGSVSLLQGSGPTGAVAVPVTGNAVGSQISIVPPGMAVTASNFATTYSPVNASTNGIAAQQFAFSYSLTAGNAPIFVPSTVLGAIDATTTVGSGHLSVSPIAISDNDATNDGPTYFYVAPGQTKAFTARYQAMGSGTSTPIVYQAFDLKYGLSSGDMSKALSGSNISNALLATLFH